MTKLKNNQGSAILLEHAFKQLHAPLYFYALKFVDNSEIAKDLVQDAFLSLLKNDQHTKIQNLKAYLYTAVRNNCLNHIKHDEITSEFAEKEKQRISREVLFYDSHQTLVEKELYENLKKAINELPEKYKMPFRLSRFENLPNKEIAEKLNLPLRTIETQIYRALKILRESVKRQGFNFFVFMFCGKR